MREAQKHVCYHRIMAKKKSTNEIGEVLEIVNFIKDRMATKEDIVRVEERMYSIEQELKEIRRRLTTLEDAFEKTGYKNKQEIELLGKHVAAIEKRLKMQRA